MKLSDFCILYVCLFLCLFLQRDLKIESLLQSRTSEIVYNRKMDRVNEDALMDITQTQMDDHSLQLDTEALQEQFGMLLKLQFDLADDDALFRARQAVVLYEIRQFPYRLSAQELDAVVEELQRCLNVRKQRNADCRNRELFLPYLPMDSFTQSVSGVQFFTVFDPIERGLWYDRVQFSGSRIVKIVRSQTDETEPVFVKK